MDTLDGIVVAETIIKWSTRFNSWDVPRGGHAIKLTYDVALKLFPWMKPNNVIYLFTVLMFLLL